MATFGVIGIILALTGGTSWLIARGRSGIDWDNPGWLSGNIYFISYLVWALCVIAIPSLISKIISLIGISLVLLYLLIRFVTAENKKFTLLKENQHGSIRHSFTCNFLMVASIIVASILSMTFLVNYCYTSN